MDEVYGFKVAVKAVAVDLGVAGRGCDGDFSEVFAGLDV